ncbi:MAG: hypothetical protein K2R98_20700 [Gemmataceae bacterium]|nr:hypothetical protein [Gemmataceae bacterium]
MDLLRPDNLGKVYRQRMLKVLSAAVEHEQERLRQAVEGVIAARRTRDQRQITAAARHYHLLREILNGLNSVRLKIEQRKVTNDPHVENGRYDAMIRELLRETGSMQGLQELKEFVRRPPQDMVLIHDFQVAEQRERAAEEAARQR